MRNVTIPSPIEKLELTVGAATVVLDIDVTADNLLVIAKEAKALKPKADALALLEAKASQRGDTDALRDVNRDTAEAIAPVVKAGIGEEGYEAVLEAAGQGTRISPARANGVMYRVLAEIMSAMGEQRAAMAESGVMAREITAVQYLAEVARAEGEPDTEA